MVRKLLVILASLIVGFASPASARDQTATAFVRTEAKVADPGHAIIPVYIWAPTTGSSLGLVVISHGASAGAESHEDTAVALARAGFVVVAPMHPGDNYNDVSAVGTAHWFTDRTRQVTRVIDFMLTQWAGHMRLAPDRIGMFGYSAGGTTALIASGGRPDFGKISTHCAKTAEFVCNLMVLGKDFSTTPALSRDRRIKAIVVAAPALGFTFAPAGLIQVKVPVQLWAGGLDTVAPPATNADVIRSLLKGRVDFHRVPLAQHLSFLAPCDADSPQFLCKDAAGFDRPAFHRQFNGAVAAFFKRELRPRR